MPSETPPLRVKSHAQYACRLIRQGRPVKGSEAVAAYRSLAFSFQTAGWWGARLACQLKLLTMQFIGMYQGEDFCLLVSNCQHFEKCSHLVRCRQSFDVFANFILKVSSRPAPKRPARSMRPIASRKSPCVMVAVRQPQLRAVFPACRNRHGW